MPNSAKTLSIVVPVYNERDTWRTLLERVQAADLGGLARQIILVEDSSRDGTREQVQELARSLPADGQVTPTCRIRVLFHEHNQGKGAAVRTGYAAATGDIVIVQDADLEYDPQDYRRLIEPILAGQADVVYGSRFTNGKDRASYLSNYLANRFLTGLSNLMTGLKLTDMETCYKAISREVLDKITIEQDRFGFEPEITAKIARLKNRVQERPIRYMARTHEQGKKIGWKDGLKTIWCILKYH